MRLALLLAVAPALIAAQQPKQLSILHPALHQFEDGPDLSPDYDFVSGETISFDFQIGGYTATEDGKVSLSWTLQVKDSTGTELIPPKSGKVETELTEKDKKWLPKIRAEIAIPPQALTGTYKILMTADDALAKTHAEGTASFQVKGHKVEIAPTLQLANLAFFRSDEDAKPLIPAAYRPGDTVWIRFDIVGFKLGDANKFDVSYGTLVLRASGESMLSQPDAAKEQGDSFYPRRYIPAGFSLNLEKDIHPGQYTIVITVHDGIAKQESETRATFSVEQ